LDRWWKGDYSTNHWFRLTLPEQQWDGIGYINASVVANRHTLPQCGGVDPLTPNSKVTLAQGPRVSDGIYHYAITLSGFVPNTMVSGECYDSVSSGGFGFSGFRLPIDASGNGFTQSKCYSGDGPDHWVVAEEVISSNHVQWGGGSPNLPQPPTQAKVTLAQGPVYSKDVYRYAVTLSGFLANTLVSIECYDSVSPSGFLHFTMTTDANGSASTQSECYSGDGPDHWVVAEGVTSNHVQWGGGSPNLPPPTATPSPVVTPTATPTVVIPTATPVPPSRTYKEQEGHRGVDTFTNPHNASGMGQKISAAVWVEVSCKVYDPTIQSVNPDGYWYRIASSPWNNAYYAPANTFMNGDPWGGPYTHNTDVNVPDC
jgi:hypothetical protein